MEEVAVKTCVQKVGSSVNRVKISTYIWLTLQTQSNGLEPKIPTGENGFGYHLYADSS